MKPAFHLKQYFNLLGIAIMLAGVLLVYLPSASTDSALTFKRELMFLWVELAYGLVCLFLYLIEFYFSRQARNSNSYKDVSLEFYGSALKTERGITDGLNQISGHKVLEVSLVYDFGGYYSLKRELNKLQKAGVADTDLRVTTLISKMTALKADLVRTKPDHYLGKGFVSFKNFLAAKEFKDLHKEAYQELKVNMAKEALRPSDQKGAADPFSVKASVVSELVKSTQKIDNKTAKAEDSELSHALAKSMEEQDLTFRRAGTFIAPKSQARFTDDTAAKLSGPATQSFAERAELKKKLVQLFGPKFRIDRGIDPETLNFRFSEDQHVNIKTHLTSGGLVFVLLPFVAYIFNYYYYYLDIGLHIGAFSGVGANVSKYLSLIATVLVDQVAFSVIDKIFTRERFFNQSRLYTYLVSYYSLYILLASLIAPNFAMKFSFLDFADRLTAEQKAETIRYLINAAFVVYYILIFGAVNYKIIRPILAGKFREGRLAESDAHGHIVFNVSFIVSSVFYVAFYGSITPLIFLIYGVTLAANYLFDFYVYYRIDYDEKTGRKKGETTAVAKPADSQDDSPVLPITVFSSACWSLIIGVFLLAMLGYYGLTSDVNQFMSKTMLGQSQGDNADIIDDVGKIIGASASGFTMRVEHALGDILMSSVHNFGVFLKNLIAQGGYYLATDFLLMLGALLYVALIVVFQRYHNNDSLLNRIQSRIWKGKERVEELKFEGKSYKEINPAYSEFK